MILLLTATVPGLGQGPAVVGRGIPLTDGAQTWRWSAGQTRVGEVQLMS
jgi:hypothetical protein